MKKILALTLAALLVCALLASCASSKTSYPVHADTQYSVADQATTGAAPAEMPSTAERGYGAEKAKEAGTGLTGKNTSASLSAEKIIYSYTTTIETTKFDETIDALNALMGAYGAFVETSYVSGSRYGYNGFRSASYTIRVPVSYFSSLTGRLVELGNVYDERMISENITAQYTDVQSRLDTYRTEESRLLAMLEKADTVEDMIAIESRLSDVRYQIESLTATLRNWQNAVDYSTINLYIQEVEELKDQLPAQRTYWQKMGDGFNATLKGIGNFFRSLFMALVVASPVILLLAVVAVIVVIVVRAAIKKRKKTPPSGPNDPQ
jgi:hypothetical protein